MRAPSRQMPVWPVQPASPALKWGCLLAPVFMAGIAAWVQPLGTAIFVGIIVPLVTLGTAAARRQRRELAVKLRAARKGDALCRFARDFDCRKVDTWLVRATFEEVQGAWHGVGGGPVPLRAGDRWREDLRFNGDDLEEIGTRIAGRAGYSLADTRGNPLYGKVRTVDEIVAFMRHQPRTRTD